MADSGGSPVGGSGSDPSFFRVLLQTISKLTQLQRIGNTLPFGAVIATTIGTANTQVLPADQNRTAVIFHNVSPTVTIMVAPVTDANGAALAPTFVSAAGGMIILPQDYLPLSGNVQMAFTAAAQTGGGGNPLTIITSSF